MTHGARVCCFAGSGQQQQLHAQLRPGSRPAHFTPEPPWVPTGGSHPVRQGLLERPQRQQQQHLTNHRQQTQQQQQRVRQQGPVNRHDGVHSVITAMQQISLERLSAPSSSSLQLPSFDGSPPKDLRISSAPSFSSQHPSQSSLDASRGRIWPLLQPQPIVPPSLLHATTGVSSSDAYFKDRLLDPQTATNSSAAAALDFAQSPFVANRAAGEARRRSFEVASLAQRPSFASLNSYDHPPRARRSMDSSSRIERSTVVPQSGSIRAPRADFGAIDVAIPAVTPQSTGPVAETTMPAASASIVAPIPAA